MISIQVSNKKQNQRFEHSGGPIEFGRGSRRTVERFVLQDIFASRDHVRLEELPGERLRVDNLSLKQEVVLGEGATLTTGTNQELELPVRLTVGQTNIEVEWVPEDAIDKESLHGLDAPVDVSAGLIGLPPLGELGEEPTAAGLGHWVQTIFALQRLATTTTDFYEQTAKAMVHLTNLDLGMVLLRRDWTWEVVARHMSDGTTPANFSPTLLSHVVAERRTYYQDLANWSSPTMSLKGADAVVVAPIFGPREDVVGALYGLRNPRFPAKGGVIRTIEAQMVQLLAGAVGGQMARAQAARKRVEYEQYFNAKVLRELERDPALLEGRNQEVTFLVAGLHHFPRVAQRLGPAVSCRLVNELLDRLTERVTENGGIIIDHSGPGLTAMWNAPARQPDHPLLACGAALAMLGELPDVNGRWQPTIGEPLRLGIGLHTGEAAVGSLGSSHRFRYGAYGANLELAGRVHKATETLGQSVLLTNPTRERLPDTLALRRLGQVRWGGPPFMLHELHGVSGSPVWLACRDAYESALGHFEKGEFPEACERLLPLVDLSEPRERLDTPSVKLLRRAWEHLETSPQPFDPVLDLRR